MEDLIQSRVERVRGIKRSKHGVRRNKRPVPGRSKPKPRSPSGWMTTWIPTPGGSAVRSSWSIALRASSRAAWLLMDCG